MAWCAHPSTRRQRLCTRCPDGLVRGQWRRLPVRPGAQRTPVCEIATELDLVAAKSRRTGRSARRFKSFMWTTRESWSCLRRVVAKAEWTQGEANPRFVVTSLRRDECKAKYLYEKLYCARGEMENRIKECQLDLYAGRTSTATMKANQLRLWFASMAYVLVDSLAPLRALATHRPGRCHLWHHPPEAVEDRRARHHQRPAHQTRHGLGMSGGLCLGLCCDSSRRRSRHRSCLARLNAPPRARHPRGITPIGPPETPKISKHPSRPWTPRTCMAAAHQPSSAYQRGLSLALSISGVRYPG